MKKKFFSTLILVACLSSYVFATNFENSANWNGNNETPFNMNVTAKYLDPEKNPVYSIDVKWDDMMELTYIANISHMWDEKTNSYKETVDASWDLNDNNIKVINHSNRDVSVKLEFKACEEKEFSHLTGRFTIPEAVLKAGKIGQYDQADSFISKLILSGELPNNIKNFTKIGSIIVSIE